MGWGEEAGRRRGKEGANRAPACEGASLHLPPTIAFFYLPTFLAGIGSPVPPIRSPLPRLRLRNTNDQ